MPTGKRKKHEVAEVIKIVQQIKFFKERKIKDNDYEELVNALNFVSKEEFENVFLYNDPGEHFYIILQGTVVVKIRNPAMDNWASDRMELKQLLEWKKLTLDRRIDEAIKAKFNIMYSHRHAGQTKDIEKFNVQRKDFKHHVRFKQGFKKSGIKFKFELFKNLNLDKDEMRKLKDIKRM